MKIYFERSSGLPVSGPRYRKVVGHPHVFEDVTNRPIPTIDTKQRHIYIEHDPMTVWLKSKPSAGFGQPPRSCSALPAPTIMAEGIGGVNIAQHFIEDDGIDMPETPSTKPPYRVMSMEEIRALPWNGFKVASTFAGGGGSSLGYRMAGFHVVYANEFIDEARTTYKQNAAPWTHVDGRDIRLVQVEDILSILKMQPGELDVLDGSPPCSSFSTAGKREKLWGKVKAYSDKEQRTDDLFFEFTRLLRGLQPKVFVAENVKGLLIGTAIGMFKEIHHALSDCGYVVEARLLNAKWLGVPQSRERTIFVGVRKDLALSPAYPKPQPHIYTVRDAIPWIRRVSSNSSFQQTWKDAGKNPAQTVTASLSEKVNVVEAETDISKYAIGGEWDKILPGQASSKYFQLVKADPDKPVGTITGAGGSGSIASIVHPYEKRKFTIPELKRLCSFPDDWEVTGSFAQQWERMGRAVPPVMMKCVAEAVRDKILEVERGRHPSAQTAGSGT